jgi:hypothetical protein
MRPDCNTLPGDCVTLPVYTNFKGFKPSYSVFLERFFGQFAFKTQEKKGRKKHTVGFELGIPASRNWCAGGNWESSHSTTRAIEILSEYGK